MLVAAASVSQVIVNLSFKLSATRTLEITGAILVVKKHSLTTESKPWPSPVGQVEACAIFLTLLPLPSRVDTLTKYLLAAANSTGITTLCEDDWLSLPAVFQTVRDELLKL